MKTAQENHVSFDKWDEIMYGYLQNIEDNKIGITDKSHEGIYSIFAQILESCIKSTRRGGKWQTPPKKVLLLAGEGAVVTSQQGIEIEFGLSETYFYMSTELSSKELSCLLSADDSFWIKLAKLSNYGRFEFLFEPPLEDPVRSRIRKITNRSKSSVVKILSNLIGYQFDGCEDDDFMLSIENQWPIGIEWNNLLEKSMETFENLYQIKYKLYRISYTRSNS